MASNDLQSRVEEGKQSILEWLNLNDQDLEFLSKLKRLGENENVEVNPYGGLVSPPMEKGRSNTFNFNVKLKKVLTQDELDKLLEQYGFPKPSTRPLIPNQMPDYGFRAGNSNYQLNFSGVKIKSIT